MPDRHCLPESLISAAIATADDAEAERVEGTSQDAADAATAGATQKKRKWFGRS